MYGSLFFIYNQIKIVIPKVIHLCWFSGDKYPVEIKRCLRSWRRILPDYTIKLWDAEAARSLGCDYINEALDRRRWAFAADAVRFYAVYLEGGVYMDSDIMLYSRFDEYMPVNGCTVFREVAPWFYLQAAFIIGEKGNRFCKDMVDFYTSRHFVNPDGTTDETISPLRMFEVAQSHGLRADDSEQHIDGYLSVYPTERLLPCRSYGGRRDRSFGIHTIYGSWRKRSLGRRIEIKLKHYISVIKYYVFRK